jgi:predicted flap endonuclease-1-like 5' DNA nuclease
MTTKRAARADPGPALLVAPEIAPTGQRLPRGTTEAVRNDDLRRIRKGVPGQAAARL